MTDAAQDPLLDAFAHLRQATQAYAAPALRSRTQSAHQQRQPYPPTDSRDGTDELMAQPPSQQQRVRTHSSRPHTQYAAVANGRDAVVSEGRARSVSADGGQKGGDWSETHQYHGHQPSVVPRKEHQRSQARTTTAAAPPGRATYNEQREQQRLRQLELARRMAASTASSTSAAYMEMVSPVRPLEVAGAAVQERVAVANGDRYTSESGRTREARGASRREAPSSIMQEFDDELSRSAGEHERPSVGMSRDVAEMEDQDADDEAEDTSHNNDNTQPLPLPPPPVVAVRVRQGDQHQQQRSYPPFQEEISSDASEHVGLQSPPFSTDTDGNPYFAPSGEMYSIPSISLTPPTSPRHQRTPRHHNPAQDPSHQRNHHSSNGSHSPHDRSDTSARGEWQSGTDVSLPKGFFSSWTFGFAAGCLVAGFGGMFMEELMEFVGVYLKNSSVTLSRSEQREMNRRLDVLQEELLNFRASTNDIEHQSQRMVQEVRSHLVKMKAERERHQQMIAKEMDLLRLYVQAITNELVEDEKKEIRKRLMETIADTVVEKRSNKATQEELSESHRDSAGDTGKEKPTAKQAEMPVEPNVAPILPTVVEVEIAAAQDAAAVLFDTLDEESVMKQIDKAISSVSPASRELPVSHTKDNNETQSVAVGVSDDSNSDKASFSWELFVLLAGIAIIAAAVGTRVQKANRRKNIYRARRHWRQQQDTATFKSATAATGDDSEVETVEFFRTGSESGLDDREVEDDEDEDEDDGQMSGCSEEHKESEEGDDLQTHEEERLPSSSEEEYEYQPAQLTEEHSEIEQIDESDRDEPPTPYRRTSKPRLQLEERQRDESPVRRSPRIQERSYLSQMR